MAQSNTAEPPGPSAEHRRLEAFVGIWNTAGDVEASPAGPAGRFEATDSYEWLSGGFFLVNRWQARMPGGETAGLEIIGYDASSQMYPMHSFDSQGNSGVMQASVEDQIWTFLGEAVRSTGRFRDAGNTIAGVWEQQSSDGSGWLPWIDLESTKVA